MYIFQGGIPVKKSNKKVIITVISVLVVVIIGVAIAFAVTANKDSKDKTEATSATKATQIVTEAQTEAETTAQTEAETSAPVETTAETTVPTESDVTMPDVTGVWKHEINTDACTVEVTSQSGNDISFTVTSVRGNAAQIATCDLSVTLDTEFDGTIVRGYAEFDYEDSFGATGTGSISVSENVILLVIEEENLNGATWSISNATGDYIFASK